jgi:predicted dehydrogenase
MSGADRTSESRSVADPHRDSDAVRLAFTGVGGRGATLLSLCLDMADVAVPAVADVQERHRERARADVLQSGRPEPATYESHERMVRREDVDGVVIATPWADHVPMAVAAMEAGAAVGLEVGPASTVEECRELVRTATATGSRCMLLENTCYYRDVMAVLGMVRDGLFGELVHCRGGYCHDLRGRLNTGNGTAADRGGGLDYRGVQNEKRNADLYPTHGVGPLAKCLGINRGNRFVSLTATASKSRGLADWAVDNLDERHPSRDVDWAMGDVVTTAITCANGETVALTHDVSLPRPYSNEYLVQGTGGLWERDSDPFHRDRSPRGQDERFGRIHLEGRSPEHAWEPFEEYLARYEHPTWAEYLESGTKSGHGGIDYLTLRDFVGAVKRNERPPIDVYDAATWMAIAPLTERSIARGGDPVDVPDFTNGAWLSEDPVFGRVDGA